MLAQKTSHTNFLKFSCTPHPSHCHTLTTHCTVTPSQPSHCHTLTTHHTVTLASCWHKKHHLIQASPATEPVETSAPGPGEEREERLVDGVSVGGQLYATSQLQTNLFSGTLGEGEGKSEDSDVELAVDLLLVNI